MSKCVIFKRKKLQIIYHVNIQVQIKLYISKFLGLKYYNMTELKKINLLNTKY